MKRHPISKAVRLIIKTTTCGQQSNASIKQINAKYNKQQVHQSQCTSTFTRTVARMLAITSVTTVIINHTTPCQIGSAYPPLNTSANFSGRKVASLC